MRFLKLRPGKGVPLADPSRYVLSPEGGAQQLAMHYTVLDPRDETMAMRFEASEQAVVCLQGEGAVRVDGQDHVMKSGDAAYIPPGRSLVLINGAEGVGQWLRFQTPPDVGLWEEISMDAPPAPASPVACDRECRVQAMAEADLMPDEIGRWRRVFAAGAGTRLLLDYVTLSSGDPATFAGANENVVVLIGGTAMSVGESFRDLENGDVIFLEGNERVDLTPLIEPCILLRAAVFHEASQ